MSLYILLIFTFYQLDGKESGKSENERTKEEIAVKKKQDHDQMIKARIRGNEALKKEKLKHVSYNFTRAC